MKRNNGKSRQRKTGKRRVENNILRKVQNKRNKSESNKRKTRKKRGKDNKLGIIQLPNKYKTINLLSKLKFKAKNLICSSI